MFQDLLAKWLSSEIYKQDVRHNVSTENVLMDFAVWLDTQRGLTPRAPVRSDVKAACEHVWVASSTSSTGYIGALCNTWQPLSNPSSGG